MAVVFTSAGIPFIYAGEEVMRDKQEWTIVIRVRMQPTVTIDWRRKTIERRYFMCHADS